MENLWVLGKRNSRSRADGLYKEVLIPSNFFGAIIEGDSFIVLLKEGAFDSGVRKHI